MRALSIALLALVLLQDDPPTLVRRLGSDDPEARQQARRALIRLGAPARPALEAALKDEDAEVTAQARDILQRIATNERIASSHFPAAEGFRWAYAVKGEGAREKTVEIGKQTEIPLVATEDQKPVRTSAWPLSGYRFGPAYVVELGDGVRIAEPDRGIEGDVMIVAIADFRWGKQKDWRTWTIEGCIAGSIQGRQHGTEKITVPAGTFECLRITNTRDPWGTTTVWLARGVGIVKRSFGKPEEVWELSSCRVRLDD